MSSDGDYGPALPPGLAKRRTAGPSRPSPPPPVGPALPQDEDSDDDAFGPALPPGLKRPLCPSPGSVRPSLPAVGPSRPPPRPSRPPPGPALPPPDSDSDDEVGPQLTDLAAPAKSAADAFREREERMARARDEAEAAARNNKPQRDEWMTLGPPTGGALANLDALKRPTQFNKTSREAAPVDQGWLESPAEKARRLADEKAGVKRARPSKEEGEEAERKRRRERDREMQRQIGQHSKGSSRGASLLEQHQAKKKASAEDDEPPAIWDHDKMMGVTGRLLTDQERAKKIKDARQLNDRFGHGQGGAYM